MEKGKNLSNPFSTGGGGFVFESRVQATFMALMLSGGFSPCLPHWPIDKITFQARVDGYHTDDMIVFIKNPSNQEERKLLIQIKRSIKITKGDKNFGEVIKAAWLDFNNASLFHKGQDAIAVITKQLNNTDADTSWWLLEHARHTVSSAGFFLHAKTAYFSPAKSREKLAAFRHHIEAANGGQTISDETLYTFLTCFHLLNCDLDKRSGLLQALLHSYISLFQQHPQNVLSRLVTFVQDWNHHAGTVTRDTVPEDIQEYFKVKPVMYIPDSFLPAPISATDRWSRHPQASWLARIVLLGRWNNQEEGDCEVISRFLGIRYDAWLDIARDILVSPDSPLLLQDGIWKVANRVETWEQLGKRILDQDLDTFKKLALDVLQEPDSTFELPVKQRPLAKMYVKGLNHSRFLRKGIAEGLALLGCHPQVLSHCSSQKISDTCAQVIRKLLTGADWKTWGSLNEELPILAEAARDTFLVAVEDTLSLEPCPFDNIVSQEGLEPFGVSYMAGLLRALEALAWDTSYLVRVCVVLGDLARRALATQRTERPFESLVSILLPWFPQTQAPAAKRQNAVTTLLREFPEIAWKLLLQLIPQPHQTSFGTYKPRWYTTIPEGYNEKIAKQTYIQESSFYAELAVSVAETDVDRLTALVKRIEFLPETALEKFLQILSSQAVRKLPVAQRRPVRKALTSAVMRFQNFDDKRGIISKKIDRIEQIAQQLAVDEPFYEFQTLFAEELDARTQCEQQEEITQRQDKAVEKIFQQEGLEGIMRFAETLASPCQVSWALGAIDDTTIDCALLPAWLDTHDKKQEAFIRNFILRRYTRKDWTWCASLDHSSWTTEQKGQFLAWLPFTQKVREHVLLWLGKEENVYWKRVEVRFDRNENNFNGVLDKLIFYKRIKSALKYLYFMYIEKKKIDINKCEDILISFSRHNKIADYIDEYYIVELIKFLQKNTSSDINRLLYIELIYIQILRYKNVVPKMLESKLANDPEFFCGLIRKAYKSNNALPQNKKTEVQKKIIAQNAWHLFSIWSTVPGTQRDGIFHEKLFLKWLTHVKQSCEQSGHLDIALFTIGQVLTHTLPDPGGLWIHSAVAKVLNDPAHNIMRNGFITATRNARGTYPVDFTGKTEKALAQKVREQADEVEMAGFQRLAATMRELGTSYDKDAERTITTYTKATE